MGIQYCSIEQNDITDVFLSIEACKPILVGTQNKIINLKMSIYVNFHSLIMDFLFMFDPLLFTVGHEQSAFSMVAYWNKYIIPPLLF